MRYVVAVAVLVFVGIAVVGANAGPLVSGATIVLFGDGVWHRSGAVLAGVEQAFASVQGVTVLVPRNRPWSLRDAELAGVETVVEIFAAEVVSREDRHQSVYLGGVSVSGTTTTVRVRLGLRFLRVLGNGQYLQFLGTGEAEGSASGMTYASAYTRWGSYATVSYANLEATAFRNAAAAILGGSR
jgi:hypothetical protein